MQVFVSYVFKPGAKKSARIQLLMPKLLSWSAVSVHKLSFVPECKRINFSVLKKTASPSSRGIQTIIYKDLYPL